jgi:hypothetical protein
MNRLLKAARIVAAALREIFDETAYQRFLTRARLPSSPQAYAAFWREREANTTPRPRCC